ncbi:hypothetical protein JX265_008216 [Neoarthrinium moseri]|uniref:Tyrosine specific protein phosphatases domain-containing protein n=1 Tax=Neoarthrinium moseri TaxID=1658444 RepID=A0A9P9WIH1_9PEZI|nr:uncharacterized protein JN550_004914 [Neoarthrinium moseri]KAI1865169.1 hypothetical protein JX265_008216 [Neoarthrinium moseri]KAI1870768.1 hypothetical protein JN550_004914 [Neoarthrinium moseri]
MADPNLPSPPFVYVQGLPNFRDIGGYPVASQPGKIVRHGVVFRSSEPSKVTDDGVAQLQALSIADVYDLRSRQEIERDAAQGHGRQAKEWAGARRIFAPVFLDEDYSPEAIALRFKNYADESSKGFVQAYQDILKSASSQENEAQPYRSILKHLATPSSGSGSAPAPILLHCTAGKDRTGVICALILSLCGVDDDVVAHEYSLTELGLKSRHAEFTRHLIKEPALKGNPAGARRMVGSRKENMTGTLNKIREIWGSVEQCVIDLNLLDEAGIEQLRRNLIIEEAEARGTNDWQSHAKLVVKAQVEADAEAERIAASSQM